MMPDSTPLARGRGIAVAAIVLFVLAVVYHGARLDFPFYYHSDEPIKVLQVQSGEFNFHHPMLLIGSVAVWNGTFTSEADRQDPQKICELGRWFSVIFLALATVLLALLAASRFGLEGFLITGLLLLLNPHFTEHGRFFKEDAALLFGIAAVPAALALLERRMTVSRMLSAGVAGGLALSAKYIGGLALVAGLIAILVCPGPKPEGRIENPHSWKRRALAAGVMLFAALGLFLLINLEPARNAGIWQREFQREMTKLTDQEEQTQGLADFSWNSKTMEDLREDLPEAVWWLAGIYLVGFVISGLWRRPSHVSLLLFILIYAIALGLTSRYSGRYGLPLSAGLVTLAGMGLAWLITQFRAWLIRRDLAHLAPPVRSALSLLVLVIGLALLVPGLYRRQNDISRQFRQDSRLMMGDWITRNVPHDAVIIQDMDTKLPAPDYRFIDQAQPLCPQVIRTVRDFEKSGVSALRDQGATHVLFTYKDYRKLKRIFKRLEKAAEKGESAESVLDDLARDDPFWVDLHRSGELLQEIEEGRVRVLQPGLWLYRLPLPPPQES